MSLESLNGAGSASWRERRAGFVGFLGEAICRVEDDRVWVWEYYRPDVVPPGYGELVEGETGLEVRFLVTYVNGKHAG